MKNLLPAALSGLILLSSCSSPVQKEIIQETNTIKEVKTFPAKVHEKNKNVYVAFEDGTEKQLTFNGTDNDPILVKDEGLVVFVRDDINPAVQRKQLMCVNIDDLSESVITQKKPFEDGLEGTTDILNIINPTLTPDGKEILFVTEKYATANELVQVNIKTGMWTDLFTAESFEQINSGQYKGFFFAAQSDIGENGRDIFYRLVNDSGTIIKKFSDEEAMNAFRKEMK
ncbi:MAG: hypothetical protein K0S32_3940 [Bacteroidetes bacterium]|jgi:hypothetical protein|nr:hypothetical protein [Bacteroidota bacterium]